MIVPNFIVKSIGHWKKNYFFSGVFSSFFSILVSALGASALGASSFLTSVADSTSFETGARFSSVTVSGLTSISIPIFFLIFSAILADLPVLSLK